MNNKETKTFLVGLVMLCVGLFILSQKVYVVSGMFRLWNMPTGTIFIPFIGGIIWLFMSGSKESKIFTGASVLIIFINLILNTHFYMRTMTLFDWIVVLTLIFGGLGLIGKAYFNK